MTSLTDPPTETFARRIRVLVVDDSAVVRKVVGSVLAEDPGIEVIGAAPDGRLALRRLAERTLPDVITLDLTMPELGGLALLDAIRSHKPRLRVLVLSALTSRGASATLDALSRGADDYLLKPGSFERFEDSLAYLRANLVPRVRALGQAALAAAARAEAPTPVPRTPFPLIDRGLVGVFARPRVQALVIEASTGGPPVVSELLAGLRTQLSVPTLVVIHMPAVFTKSFADRLAVETGLDVREAEPGGALAPGRVWIARGGVHMTVSGDPYAATVRLDEGPPVQECRPSVDVLFESAAQVFGGATLGLVLTGMGKDGLAGTRAIVGCGGEVLAQGRDSCVVFGMPGAVVAEGLALEVTGGSGPLTLAVASRLAV